MNGPETREVNYSSSVLGEGGDSHLDSLSAINTIGTQCATPIMILCLEWITGLSVPPQRPAAWLWDMNLTQTNDMMVFGPPHETEFFTRRACVGSLLRGLASSERNMTFLKLRHSA